VTTPQSLQAVVLAAGVGRRMQPLTQGGHKALLPVAGMTILGRIVDGLEYIGLRRATIVTGWKADEVERFLGERAPSFELSFVNSPQFAETNNIVSLSLALDSMTFDADVVLIECDLLFDPSLLRRLTEAQWPNVALVDRYRTGMDGTVVSISNGFIDDVYPTESQHAGFSYEDKFKTLNIYRLHRDFCRDTLAPLVRTYAREVDSNSYYELVLGMLSNLPAHRIAADVVQGERWFEVDDPNDIVTAEFGFEPNRRGEILRRAFGGHWNFDVLDFSLMRNAYFPTASMLASIRHALPDLIGSYGSSQEVLNQKLSYFLRCDSGRVQVLHGASQAFPILQSLFRSAKALTPEPTFGEYARAFPDASHYRDAPGVDFAALGEHAAASDVCVIVNPNTTTGTLLESEAVHALARRLEATSFIVDESFLAFSAEPSLVNLLEREPLPNVIVLTSLSKTLGAPGLRLGYVYSCNTELIESIGAALPVWNLSAPAEYLLELMLKFGPAYERSLTLTAADREVFSRELSKLSVVSRVYPSGGDFLVAELHGNTSRAATLREDLLRDYRIEIKDVSERFPDRRPRVRLAVRLATENARLLDAITSLTADSDRAGL
jgi:histidinol-phosphate/aromatic aminotransferase/cobyric acid decarboxylase-like protein/choline kinase